MSALGIGPTLAPRHARRFPVYADVALLGLWEADDLTDGATAAWIDRIGGYSVGQAVSGARPIRSATAVNGRSGVTFDGLDDFLGLESVPFPAIAEVWALIRQDATDAASRRIFSDGGTGVNNSRSVSRSAANKVSCAAGNGSASFAATEPLTDFTGVHIVRARFEAAQIGTSVDASAMTFTAVVPSIGTNRMRMGASTANTPANFGQCAIAVLAVSALNDARQAAVLQAILRERGRLA